ncbi:hypothetical protein N9X61_00570 [Sulfurimonas sp.]|nr:hypothetical protein [Sulfurimonas sp.]
MKLFIFLLSLVVVAMGQEIVSSGEVLVNGEPVTTTTQIKQGDTIETKANSKIRFNIAKDAFLAKSNAKFKLEKIGKKRVLNVLNGGVMAVFGGGNHGVATPNMTAGIRGTGIFAAVKDGKTYFCTCHGETVVEANGQRKVLKAKHHKMVWITPTLTKDTMDMQGHEDHEIVALEAMVGRTLPAAFH